MEPETTRTVQEQLNWAEMRIATLRITIQHVLTLLHATTVYGVLNEYHCYYA